MFQKSLLVASSIALWCTAPASFAQDPAPKPAASVQAVPQQAQSGDAAGPMAAVDRIIPTKDSEFGEPLFVNGRRVTDDEIKLYIIYGPGKLLLELYRQQFITEDEITRQANENVEFEFQKREAATPFASKEERKKQFDAAVSAELDRLHAKYKLSEEELQKEYDASIEDFKKTYPILNVPAEISRSFRSIDWYVRQLNQALYFDRVFLPPNPEEWPTVTIEAMRADSGELLIEDALKSYQQRKEAADKAGDPLYKEDAIYWNMMRQIVRDAIYKTLDIRTSLEGIPNGIALWIDANADGNPELAVPIAEFWKRLADSVTPAEVEEAKHWFVTYYATRDRLEKEGAGQSDPNAPRFVLTPDECAKALSDVDKSLEGSYMTLELFAVAELQFPAVEIYKPWTCLREGFKRYMAPKLEGGPAGEFSPLLRDYAVQANKIMGLGTVDIDVMLISAFDIPHNRWKPNGWAWAKAKAEEINASLAKNMQENAEERRRKAEAKAEGKEYIAEREVMDPVRFWSQMMEDHSEYWDPPPPDGPGKRVSEVSMKKRGRFGAKYRNDLQPFVGETPLRHWVTGESITDYAFFEQGEGTVAGPFKGPLGYYLTRVAKRTAPTRPLNFADPRYKELLRDDFLRVAFVQFAKEAVAKATIKGF